MDSVKSTFTVLEEGTCLKRGAVSIGVGDFQLEDTNFLRGAVRFSCTIGVFDLEEGV